MLIGYARVSTKDQDHALQLDALRKAGCERIFEETASGTKEDRPELAKMLGMFRKDDTLVVWRLDRLARSIRHLIQIAADLQERGVHLKSLSDNIDTSTASGELHFHMLAALAQFERKLIQERVNAGLASARAAGRIGGRPAKLTPEQIHKAGDLIAAGHSVASVAKDYGVHRATLGRALDDAKTLNGSNRNKGEFRNGFRNRNAGKSGMKSPSSEAVA
jgi:DNA invertase Pin-like site-specific DNA recombinase